MRHAMVSLWTLFPGWPLAAAAQRGTAAAAIRQPTRAHCGMDKIR